MIATPAGWASSGRRNATRLAGEHDRRRVGGVHAGEHLHERGLAGAVLADDRVHLAGRAVEVDAVEDPHAEEGLADAAHLEQRSATLRPPPMPRALRGGEDGVDDLRAAGAVGERREPVGRALAGDRRVRVGDEQVEAVEVALRVAGGRDRVRRGLGPSVPGSRQASRPARGGRARASRAAPARSGRSRARTRSRRGGRSCAPARPG